MVIDSNLSFCTVKKLLAISHSLFIARIHRDRQIVLRQFRLCVGLPYGELYAFRKPVGTIKKRQISGRQFFRKNIDGFALSAQKIRKAKCGASPSACICGSSKICSASDMAFRTCFQSCISITRFPCSVTDSLSAHRSFWPYKNRIR